MSELKTINLGIGYREKILLEDINVSVEGGNLIGLVGQNGVGKSTLLRTLGGFQKCLKGSFQIDQQEINDLSKFELATKVGVVLTEKPSALNLNVLELLCIGRHPYSGWLGQLADEDIEIIEKAIEQTQIHYLLEKRLYQLSDGQLQKVMIARALAQDTDIILLDEPTSHLDLRNKVEVLELLKEISQSGKAVLMSTHEIRLASKVCDQFWCMDFGKPLEFGKPNDLLKSGRLKEILHLKDGVL